MAQSPTHRGVLALDVTLDVMKPIHIRSGAQETRWFVRLLAGLAVFAIGGAVIEWLTPSYPPFRGRLAWIFEAVFALSSSTGLVVVWLLVAVALAATASFIWRHTAKLPTDRWF
jgi:hypothetical protein